MSEWHPGVLITLFFFLGFMPMVVTVLVRGISRRTDWEVGSVSVLLTAAILIKTGLWIPAAAFAVGALFGYVVVTFAMICLGNMTEERVLSPPIGASEAFHPDEIAEITWRRHGMSDPNEISFDRTEEQLLLWYPPGRLVDTKA
jgi:hypothetical protein